MHAITECFSLSELKERATAAGHTRIRRDVDGAHTVALATWNGVSTEAGSAFSHVNVWYNLDGNIVIVHKLGEKDIRYVLS